MNSRVYDVAAVCEDRAVLVLGEARSDDGGGGGYHSCLQRFQGA